MTFPLARRVNNILIYMELTKNPISVGNIDAYHICFSHIKENLSQGDPIDHSFVIFWVNEDVKYQSSDSLIYYLYRD